MYSSTIKFDVKKTKKKITIKINGMEKFSKKVMHVTQIMNAFFQGERFYLTTKVILHYSKH